VPTHYLGGLTLALALGSLSIRRGPVWRVWVTAIASLGLLASLGPCTSPIWAARAAASASGSATVRDWLTDLGPLDPVDPNAVRRDGYLADSDGSIYWALGTVVPGFRHFRYPAKLFTLTAVAMAALAGLGWDRIVVGRGRRTAAVFLMFLVPSLFALVMVLSQKDPILAYFHGSKTLSYFGPLDGSAAYRAIIRGLGHAAIVFGIGLVLTILAPKHPGPANWMALILMTADLTVANSRYVMLVPQSLFEAKSEAVQVIEDAERADRSPEPFRVHRLRGWNPRSWAETTSSDRLIEVNRWEHDTLDPKHGIAYGVEYAQSLGLGQLAGYEPFFASTYLRVPDDRAASVLGVEVGEPVLYFAHRAFDLWNTRYLIVPFEFEGSVDLSRSAAPFLFHCRQVYPDPAAFEGPQGAVLARRWSESRDYRVLRNLSEFPRAWVVHDAREGDNSGDLLSRRYKKSMKELLYEPDPVWNDASQPVYDPHSVAWIAREDRAAIRGYLSGQKTGASETVNVTYPSPEQAVLDVRLDSPGVVVLADVDYPGWELMIDGKPAPTYRVNGLMRGAAVSAGHHRLIYTYAPRSFQIGRLLSLAGLTALVAVSLACARWPSIAVFGEWDESGSEGFNHG
jgi:hypothetical protein